MDKLPRRIDDLAARAAWLRTLSTPFFLCGIFLAIFGLAMTWPEPGSPGVLNQKFLLVPHELVSHVEGPVIYPYIERMEPADHPARVMFGLLPAALWLFGAAASFIKPWFLRGVVMLFGWPVVFWGLAALAANPGQVAALGDGSSPTSKYGMPATITPLRGTNTARRRVNITGLSPVQADQAHFVRAQQAYLDEQPNLVGEELRAMNGTWAPDDDLSRSITGVLADYATAHGQNPGSAAPKIADGRPYWSLRWTVTTWLTRLGIVLAIIGLVLDTTGLRRQWSVRRFRAAMTSLFSAEQHKAPNAVST